MFSDGEKYTNEALKDLVIPEVQRLVQAKEPEPEGLYKQKIICEFRSAW